MPRCIYSACYFHHFSLFFPPRIIVVIITVLDFQTSAAMHVRRVHGLEDFFSLYIKIETMRMRLTVKCSQLGCCAIIHDCKVSAFER